MSHLKAKFKPTDYESMLTHKFVEDVECRDSNVKYVKWPIDEEYSIEVVVEALVKNVLLNAVRSNGWCRERLFLRDKQVIKPEHYEQIEYIGKLLTEKSSAMQVKYMPRFENRTIEIKRNPHIAWICYQRTLNEIFHDGIMNVGRILAYLAFVLTYCKMYMENEKAYLVEDLIMKAAEILNTHAGTWIRRHQGWQQISKFLEEIEI